MDSKLADEIRFLLVVTGMIAISIAMGVAPTLWANL